MALTLDISSSTNQLLSGETATFTFTFSEELVLNESSAFTASDISAVSDDDISLGTFSDVKKDDTNPKVYTAKFTPTNNLIASGNVFIAFNSVRTVSGDGWQNRDALFPVSIITKAIYSLTNTDGTSERVSVPEGTGDAANSIQLKVSRSGDTRSPGSVFWDVVADASVSTDIALADSSDFSTGTTRLPGGVVSFAANETEQTINIDVSQDKRFEPDEIFRVILSEASSNDSTGTEISASQTSVDVLLTTDDPDTVPPVITSGDKAGTNGSILEGTHLNEIVYRATATDTTNQISTPSTANITFSLKEDNSDINNDSSLFSIDELTGDVRLTIAANFENPKDADGNINLADNIYGFVVVATDQAGNTTEKSVSLEVKDVALAPVVTSPSSVSINENSGAPQAIYTTTIEDYSPYTVFYALKDVGDHEKFTIDINTGVVSLISTEFPDYERKNSYNFTISLNGTEGVSEKAVSLSINDVNEASVVTGDLTAATREDTSVTGKISATDPEGLSDGNYFSITSANQPSSGTATIHRETGAWVYAPRSNFNGSDSFTVTVTDDRGGTTTQLISVDIEATADAPVISGDLSATSRPYIGNREIDQPITGTITATDPDNRIGTSSTFAIAEGSSPTFTGGAAAITRDTGFWSYSPKVGYGGPDTFVVEITDATGSTTEQTIRINLDHPDTNEPSAIAGDLSGEGIENTTTQITGVLTALDVEGLTDETIFSISSAASNGEAFIRPSSGRWIYTPNANFSGTDSFTVTVTDDEGGKTQQPITISIDPSSKPVLTTDSGVSGDNITSVTNPSFSGIVDASSDVELRITTAGNPNTLTETFSVVGVADSQGVWNLTLGDDVSLSDGTYTVAATSTVDGETETSVPLLITVDTTSPTFSITSNETELTGGETAAISFTLSESSTDFGVEDVIVSGGNLKSFAGAGTNYTATFTPTHNSTADGVVSVTAGAFTDAAGNASTGDASVTMSVNTVTTLGSTPNPGPTTDPEPTPNPTPTPAPATSSSSSSPSFASAPTSETINLDTSADFKKSQSGNRILAQAPRGDLSIPSGQTEKLKVRQSADDGIEIELTDIVSDLDLTSRSSNVVFDGRQLKSSTIRFEEGLTADLVSTAELVEKTTFLMTEGKDKATFNSGEIKKTTIEAGGGKDEILIGQNARLTKKTTVDLGGGKDKLTIEGEVKKAIIDLGDDNQKDKIIVDALDLVTKKMVIKNFGKKDKLFIDGEKYKKSAIEDEDQRIGKIRIEFLDATTMDSSEDDDSSDITKVVVSSSGFDFL